MSSVIRLKRGRFNPPPKLKRKKIKNRTGMPNGRPRVYTKEVGEYICQELMKGRTLTKICRDENVPSIVTVFKWLNSLSPKYEEEFLKLYIQAREVQAEVWADMTNDIADDGENDTYVIFNKKTGELETRVDHDIVRRSELRVKTKQWLAAHLLPKKFSNRVEVTGEGGKSLIPTTTKLVVNFVKPEESVESNK